MKPLALIVAALVPVTAPADRSQPIAIHPGEALTIEIRNQAPMLIERGRAPPMSDFEAALLQRMLAQEILAGSGIQPAIPVQSGSIDADPPKPVPGQVRLIYRQVPGPTPGSEPHSLLVLLNGYDKSFRYRVLMHSKGNVRPTDVCEVLPQVVGNEHWPYPIDQLDLTAVWLEAPEDGNIRCE